MKQYKYFILSSNYKNKKGESNLLKFQKNIMIHRKNIFQEFQKESSRDNIS